MKYIKVNDITNDLTLARNITTGSGQLLLKSGIELNRSYIKILNRYDIESVAVLEAGEEPKSQMTKAKRIELKREIKPHKKKLFQNGLIDEMMEEMLYQIVETAIMEEWYNE